MRTEDQRNERALNRFLKEIGPSRAVERFLTNHGNVKTKRTYAMQLVEYKRWLVKEGVALGWDELPRDNLRCIFESGPTDVETKRTHMDWLRRYLNVYLIERGHSEIKRKIASCVVREFYGENDSPLFGHLKEAEQKPRQAPKPLTAEDIRKVLLALPDRFRTPLLVEWQSGIEINRVIEMDDLQKYGSRLGWPGSGENDQGTIGAMKWPRSKSLPSRRSSQRGQCKFSL